MKHIVVLAAATILSVSMLGCKSEPESSPQPPGQVPPGGPSRIDPAARQASSRAVEAIAQQVIAKQVVEAGCGSCIFKMDGVKGCVLAVKIAGKAYLVKGSDVNAHEAGLCNGAKSAEAAGAIERGVFIASSFDLKE